MISDVDILLALITGAPSPPEDYSPKMELKYDHPTPSDLLHPDFMERTDIVEQMQRFIDGRIQTKVGRWPDVRSRFQPLITETGIALRCADDTAKLVKAWHENMVLEKSEFAKRVEIEWRKEYARTMMDECFKNG